MSQKNSFYPFSSNKDYHSFPLEEDYDIDPTDSYGLSKLVNEKTARAFAMRSGVDIYALRIGNVIEPHEYEGYIPKWIKDPAFRKRIAWSYIDARDLGQITRLAVETDGRGFEIFNAANTVLDQMQKAQEAGEQLDEAELQCGMEARFFRGWCYFNLVRAFGEVPLVDFAITNSDEANIPKSSVDKIYELIDADLTAAEGLPRRWE